MGHRFKKQKKDEAAGHSYYVECKEHVSIKGRGSVLIKNTQTQVRELYKRHVAIAPEEPSTSSCCSKILDTSQKMRNLNDKIETEIGKLKTFRDRFLKKKDIQIEKKPESVKKPRVEIQKPRKELPSPNKSKNKQFPGKSRQLAIEAPIKQKAKEERQRKDTSISSNKQVKKIEHSSGNSVHSKPYFCTISSLSSSPTLNNSKEEKTMEEPVKLQELPQDSERIEGGCSLVYNADDFSPCSTYQSDYNPIPASPSSYPYHCQVTSYPCYDYTSAVYDPYLSNQCPMDAVYHCSPTLPLYDNCSPSDYSRRTTDLQCDDYLRNLTPSPKEKLTPKSATSSKKMKRATKPGYPSKGAQKVGQFKGERQSQGTKSTNGKHKLKVTISKQDSDDEPEKLRLHSEYLRNYKLEHEKTAKKESSSKSSLPGKHATYTKLVPGVKIKADPDAQLEEAKSMKDAPKVCAKECIGYGTQTAAPNVQDVGLNCSLDCTPCNANPELKKKCVGCATQVSGPQVKDVGLNCSLSCTPCIENPELKKKCVGCATQVSTPLCQDIGLNCSLSQRAICNQSCQTSTSYRCYQQEIPTQNGASSRTETSTRLQLSPTKSSELCVAEMIKNTRLICTPNNRQHRSAPQIQPTTAAEDNNSLNTVYVRQGSKQSSPPSTNRFHSARQAEEVYSSPDTTKLVSMLDESPRGHKDPSTCLDEESSMHFSLPINSCDNSMYSNRTSPGSKWHLCNTPTSFSSPQSSQDETVTSNNEQSFGERLACLPSNSIVCEKRTRCVKFEDENRICERIDTMKCARQYIDWEQLWEDSKEDVTCLETLDDIAEDVNQEDSHINDSSYRSSSTADMTCIESACDEEDYLTCTESRTEHTLPCFSGCGCMRERYHMLMLEALTKPIGQ
ncbi:uncharacterized protein LOC117568246 [Drosophila albomicans]|uniref:Uncharacterized protein LOC117568246 n=1 Tax=Drosophila albomicans TaxID=7291 RepID=A0A6P8WLT1_DROAB|nr:uncharacterized protein LOC117568246 [Drosophila albomicans]